MATHRFRSSGIYHVLGEGWYVDVSQGFKGPFVRRELAERYLEALAGLAEHGNQFGGGRHPASAPELIVLPHYVGLERRKHHRRGAPDRRSRIRLEAAKRPRRSDTDRRAAPDPAGTARRSGEQEWY